MSQLIYRVSGKRIMDLLITIPALVVLTPCYPLIALLLRMSLDAGSPYFYQERPGLAGKLFVLYKFRTMNSARAAGNILLPDSDRLSGFGKILRIASLDELPELWNVLKGDMSLVGPRPLLKQYLERYTSEQARRHEVQPGITGWAQVNGRNALTWEERFRLDVWYVDHVSFWLDMKILALTAWKVLKREGINQPGHATMKEFTGTGNEG
jgi:sugar transferase EpsL